MVSLQAMSAQAALSAAPGVLRQRRYRCWCPSCAGRAEQPVSADHWHINASLGRALSQAKRAGFLWRQRAREQQRSLFWLKQGAVQKARAVQKALDILLELDVRLVCEASGQGFFMHGQPRLLQQMLSEPGLVLARPGWLREYLCGIWIGAGAYADARGEHTMSVWRVARRRPATRTPRICKVGPTPSQLFGAHLGLEGAAAQEAAQRVSESSLALQSGGLGRYMEREQAGLAGVHFTE